MKTKLISFIKKDKLTNLALVSILTLSSIAVGLSSVFQKAHMQQKITINLFNN